MFYLQTPGGGGFGKKEKSEDEPDRKKKRLEKEGPSLSKVGSGSVYDYKRVQESA